MLRLFHPLLFYPLALLVAGLIIAIGIEPQKWPRPPAPVNGAMANGELVLRGAAFDTPDPSPDQSMMVIRDFWGRAQTLRIAVLPDQPAPTPADHGVRILLSQEASASLEGRPVIVEVTYSPIPLNTAVGLAVSLQGSEPAAWVQQRLPEEAARLRFEMPAQSGVNAIGLRAISNDNEQAFGLEIQEVRVLPRS